MAVLLGIGAAFRIAAYLGGRNLWIDEAMLALNLVERTYGELLQPLDWNQAAPVGFLLSVKLAMSFLGTSETALRFVPLAGSLLSLVGFAYIASKLLPPRASLLAVALYAFSSILVDYSAELKPYVTDAAVTVGLLAVSHAALSGRGGPGRWMALALAGSAAVWFSFPSAFVLGGIGSALMAESLGRRDWRRFGAALVTSAAWFVSFVANYYLFARQIRNSEVMQAGWGEAFLPFPPRSFGDLAWLSQQYFGAFGQPGGLAGSEIHAGGLAAVFFIIGLWAAFKERWVVAWVLAVPWLLALVASGFGAYPFLGRFLMFLVPTMVLGVARGAWTVADALRHSQPLAATAMLAVLVAAPCLEAYQFVRHPVHHEQIEPVIAYVRSRLEPGDAVYLYPYTVPAFLYYTRDNAFPHEAVVRGVMARELVDYRTQMLRLAGRRRVWVLLSHVEGDEAAIRAYAQSLGDAQLAYSAPGASVYLVIPNVAASP